MSNIQQVQQRAPLLAASAKVAQAFISPAGQKKADASTAPPSFPQWPTTQTRLAPVQNSEFFKYNVKKKACSCDSFFPPAAYVNYIPLGTAVIEVGNNLHLILPDDTFPVTSSSNPVNSVLTPIGHMQTSMLTLKQTCSLPAVTPLQKNRTTAPILIPALARKSLTSTLAGTHAGPAPPVSAAPAMAVKVRAR